jgi:hypothetical protein
MNFKRIYLILDFNTFYICFQLCVWIPRKFMSFIYINDVL